MVVQSITQKPIPPQEKFKGVISPDSSQEKLVDTSKISNLFYQMIRC